jgi:hypothetical protein
MVPALQNKLLAMQGEREEYRKLCRDSYNSELLDFVYVDELGERVKPDYITQAFNRVLRKNGLRKIRFHDLRRILCVNTASSSIATTAKKYSARPGRALMALRRFADKEVCDINDGINDGIKLWMTVRVWLDADLLSGHINHGGYVYADL